jgi:hypothetical protein
MKYRLRYLLMTSSPIENCTVEVEKARNEGVPFYLGSFRVEVDNTGEMISFSKVETVENSEDLRHFYCMTKTEGEPRFNYQTYADTMSKEAMDKFIAITHEAYKREVGEDFGQAVPSIFFDEPQCIHVELLPSGSSKADACTHCQYVG